MLLNLNQVILFMSFKEPFSFLIALTKRLKIDYFFTE